MATRSATLLIVVMSPTTSYRWSLRSVCSAHAESFPLLHDSRVFKRRIAERFLHSALGARRTALGGRQSLLSASRQAPTYKRGHVLANIGIVRSLIAKIPKKHA